MLCDAWAVSVILVLCCIHRTGADELGQGAPKPAYEVKAEKNAFAEFERSASLHHSVPVKRGFVDTRVACKGAFYNAFSQGFTACKSQSIPFPLTQATDALAVGAEAVENEPKAVEGGLTDPALQQKCNKMCQALLSGDSSLNVELDEKLNCKGNGSKPFVLHEYAQYTDKDNQNNRCTGCPDWAKRSVERCRFVCEQGVSKENAISCGSRSMGRPVRTSPSISGPPSEQDPTDTMYFPSCDQFRGPDASKFWADNTYINDQEKQTLPCGGARQCPRIMETTSVTAPEHDTPGRQLPARFKFYTVAFTKIDACRPEALEKSLCVKRRVAEQRFESTYQDNAKQQQKVTLLYKTLLLKANLCQLKDTAQCTKPVPEDCMEHYKYSNPDGKVAQMALTATAMRPVMTPLSARVPIPVLRPIGREELDGVVAGPRSGLGEGSEVADDATKDDAAWRAKDRTCKAKVEAIMHSFTPQLTCESKTSTFVEKVCLCIDTKHCESMAAQNAACCSSVADLSSMKSGHTPGSCPIDQEAIDQVLKMMEAEVVQAVDAVHW